MENADLRSGLALALRGRYELEGELGSGGMAIVYGARDLRHPRRVAVKLLRLEQAMVVGADRFLREVNLTAGLQHPHVVALLDSGRIEVQGVAVPYYVMPLVLGQSLRALLDAEGHLPVATALRIARDVADGLDYTHAQQVIHRDIKPENILLNQSGAALIADFGVASVGELAVKARLSETGATVGTPLYMSPEQLLGKPLDHRTDQYSLAATVYEMLTGRVPHEGPTREALIARRIAEPPDRVSLHRPGLPRAIDKALDRALGSLGDRYSSVGEFVRALEVAAQQPATGRYSNRAAILIAGALSATALITVLIRAALPGANTAELPPLDPTLVAVLPVAPAGRDSASQTTANGLGAELRVRLTPIRGLRVVPAAILRRAMEDSLDRRPLARKVAAGTVVSSRVLRASSAVLEVGVSVRNGTTGEAMFDSVFGGAGTKGTIVASTVASRVARLLGVPDSSTHEPTASLEAHQHYLRGRALLAGRNRASLALAAQSFSQAVRLDPALASARGGLAYTLSLLVFYGWSFEGYVGPDLIRRAAAETNRALAADSSNAEAWLARGGLQLRTSPTLVGARDAIERAIALNPDDPEAYHAYGALLRRLGEDEAGITACRHALELDPTRVPAMVELASAFMRRRDVRSALLWLERARQIDSTTPMIANRRALLEVTLGDTGVAQQSAAEFRRLSGTGFRRGFLAEVLLQLRRGDTAAALATIRAQQDGGRSPAPLLSQEANQLAVALLSVGKETEARRILDRAEGYEWWLHLGYAEWDPFRSRPWFGKLVARLEPPGAPPIPTAPPRSDAQR